MRTKNSFTVVLTRDEDDRGIVNASVPALPGCFSYGRGKKEAMEHISEAIECYLESMEDDGDSIPEEIGVEQVEVTM